MTVLSFIQVYVSRVNIFDVKKGYRTYLFIRSLLGGLGIPALFIGLKYIPAIKATLIYNIHPILVAVLAHFILKEQITKLKILAVIGSFIGVIFFTANKNDSVDNNQYYFLGIGLVTFTCFCSAGVAITLRIINQHIHYSLSPFWFSMGTMIAALVFLVIHPSVYNFTYYTWRDCTWFMLSGVFNYGGQIMKSLAFKYEDASFVSPFQYLQVLYLFI